MDVAARNFHRLGDLCNDAADFPFLSYHVAHGTMGGVIGQDSKASNVMAQIAQQVEVARWQQAVSCTLYACMARCNRSTLYIAHLLVRLCSACKQDTDGASSRQLPQN